MKVDPSIPQPAATLPPPARPEPRTAGQASERPVDRPNQDESAENRPRSQSDNTAAAASTERADSRRAAAERADRPAAEPPPPPPRSAADPSRVGELLDVLA